MTTLPEIEHKVVMSAYKKPDVVKELEKEFLGRGEVRGFSFKQLHKNDTGYMYKVNTPFLTCHYEVFQRKINRRYNCVSYPQSASFGISAWTYFTLELAMEKYNELERNKSCGAECEGVP